MVVKMSEQQSVVFYPGKARLIPIAFNIAIAPILLYFSGVWAWPPAIFHIAVFVLTTIVAIQFVKRSTSKPRIIFDNQGIHFAGVTYPTASIIAIQPYMRALIIKINKEGKEKEKIVNLWWAGKEDIRLIYETAKARYKVMD
jgi:fucose 4-O-acetylase-like acetyltransferase